MKIFFFIIALSFNTNIYAINVATVDIDSILNKSSSYQGFIDEITKFIDKKTLNFRDNEIILQKNKEDIEAKKNILNESEFNNLILIYNEDLDVYQNNINNFNLIIDENIEINKKIIINKIIEILKEISIQDNYDFILTNDNYLLAQNKFDISNQVINKLNNYKIILDTYELN